MIKSKHIGILLIAIFALYSCEKIIVIDLKGAKPKIVIEGQLVNKKGSNLISLSTTNSFYSDSILAIDGATVTITDENNNIFNLEEKEPGLYNNKFLKAFSNLNYKLHVEIGSEIFEAESRVPSDVLIDSLKIELNDFLADDNQEEDLHYSVTTYFLDNPDEVNYYRLRLIINGKFMSGFYIVDDKYFNGKTIPYKFNGIVLNNGDQVWVQLMGIDKANFDYFYTLQRLHGNGPDITPGNPPTNISGNAIGIFGASTLDDEIVIFSEK